jgi:hypothetical protein
MHVFSLLLIQEVLNSILDPEAGYSYWKAWSVTAASPSTQILE